LHTQLPARQSVTHRNRSRASEARTACGNDINAQAGRTRNQRCQAVLGNSHSCIPETPSATIRLCICTFYVCGCMPSKQTAARGAPSGVRMCSPISIVLSQYFIYICTLRTVRRMHVSTLEIWLCWDEVTATSVLECSWW
jgi:hypothetical protein